MLIHQANCAQAHGEVSCDCKPEFVSTGIQFASPSLCEAAGAVLSTAEAYMIALEQCPPEPKGSGDWAGYNEGLRECTRARKAHYDAMKSYMQELEQFGNASLGC